MPFSFPGYAVYRTDRPPRLFQRRARNQAGGSAILVHRRLVHRESNVLTTCDSTTVIINTRHSELQVSAVYVSPAIALLQADLDALLGAPEVLIGGDLNAAHTSWNCPGTNAKGRMLDNYLARRGDAYVVAPDEPTCYAGAIRGQANVLDLAIQKDVRFPVEAETLDELSSDHLPVLLTVHTSVTSRDPPRKNGMTTNWAHFHHQLTNRLVPPPLADTAAELDAQVNNLHSVLGDAVAAASRPAAPRPWRNQVPEHVKAQINKRRRLLRSWKQSRNPLTKRHLNRQNELVKRLLDEWRTDDWDQFLSTLHTEDGSVWRTAKTLRSTKPTVHPLSGRQGMAYTAHDRAEVFAESMEQQFSPNENVRDDAHIHMVESRVDAFFAEDANDLLEPFTLQEVKNVVARAKPRKAPGLDRISNRALQSAPPVLLIILLQIFNSVLRLRHFPDTWKKAKVILFFKTGKNPTDPRSYRPISLLPVISKIFERLLHARLAPILQAFIRPEQFGCRPGHSTVLQLVRVVNHLVDNHNNNRATAAVLLDFKAAFDKVWHPGLIYKLILMIQNGLPPSLVHLLRSYLDGRTFVVCVDGELSTVRTVQAGVPQGSGLASDLFAIYVNDFPLIPEALLSMYVDDVLIKCNSMRPYIAADHMQRQLDAVAPWLRKWRIAANADKSQAIIFNKFHNMPRRAPDPVTLNGEIIRWTPTVKYLGVHLDKRLSFTHHARMKAAEAKKISGSISPLLGYHSKLSIKTKLMLFQLIVRACIMYASTAWWGLLTKTSSDKLERVQNVQLRRISKMPWFVRNSTIRAGLGEHPTLDEFARTNAQRLFSTAAESNHDHINDIAGGDDEDRRKPRPRALLRQRPP